MSARLQHTVQQRTVQQRLSGKHCILRRPMFIASLCLLTVPAPSEAASEDAHARLETALRVLQRLVEDWQELTIECNYAEVDRGMLGASNKTLLLQKASGNYQTDSSVVTNTCRSSSVQVRKYLKLSADSPLGRVRILLSKPSTLDLVDPENLDAFISATERFERAAAAADATAYASSMGDFSAQTGFAVEASNSSPNLERARELTIEVRDTITELLTYLPVAE